MGAKAHPWDRWLSPAAVLAEVMILAVGVALAVIWLDRHAPPQDLPWKPLAIDQPPGLFTRAKLQMSRGEGCRRTVAAAGLLAIPAPERQQGFCRLHDVVRVAPTRLAPAQPPMVCRQAEAYAVWERHVAAPAALGTFGSPLVRVEHYGTYACRRQYSAEQGRVSEHAAANAIDIAGFVLADGRRITVARDWSDEGAKGRFLHEVRGGACRIFNVTLSPDFNAAHHDHLHLDMGGFHTCR
jgi:hypothetical protein